MDGEIPSLITESLLADPSFLFLDVLEVVGFKVLSLESWTALVVWNVVGFIVELIHVAHHGGLTLVGLTLVGCAYVGLCGASGGIIVTIVVVGLC